MKVLLKTPAQIEGIRKSCKLAADTLKYLGQFVQEGVTTDFIDGKAVEYLNKHNAVGATLNYRGYPRSTCISVNDVVCHGIPNTKTILKEGDIVNVDVACILNRYYGDTCRMYSVGKISAEAQRLLDVTKACLNAGIRECRPYNKLGNIGYVIGQLAHKNGYSVVYQFCGHGVGVEFHEDPEVNHIADKNSGITLKPGMTFTIEPMINEGKARVKIDREDKWTVRTIDGKLSAQYEHTILITETGYEVLTDVDGEYPL